MPLDVFRTDGGVYHEPSNFARQLQGAGMRVEQLRTLDTLQKEEWIEFDNAVVEAAQEVLIGAADLQAAGLTFNVPNGLGTTILEWQNISDMSSASVSMNAETATEMDRTVFGNESMPLPLIHHGWNLSARTLEASRRRGDPLDTTMADAASRQVSEMIEEIIFQGLSGITFGGATIRGYTDHPSRITKTLSTNWDASAKSPVDIKDDVLEMVQLARDKLFNGPYFLYVPANYATVLGDDYTDGTGSGRLMTIRDRLVSIEQIREIRVADFLPDDNVVLVQMTRNVVDLVNVVEPMTVEWSSGNGFLTFFEVIASQLPRIKVNHSGDTGIVHLS